MSRATALFTGNLGLTIRSILKRRHGPSRRTHVENLAVSQRRIKETYLRNSDFHMKSKQNIPESSVQKSILDYLKLHRDVAFIYRSNSGAGLFTNTVGGTSRFVRFGFKGLSDITGMMKGGRALYIEVKSTTGKRNDEQDLFIKQVNDAGGIAFVARSIDDVRERLVKETNQKGD